MIGTEMTTKIPEWDAVEDITMKQVQEYDLLILPYFFDKDRAKRLNTEYIYLGLMEPSKKAEV